MKKMYLEMTNEDLKNLADADLFEAVLHRTESVVDQYLNWKDGVDALNPSQKIFYSVEWLVIEVENGGISQFFYNDSRMVAPFVSEYLKIIGADEHKKLYDDFVCEHDFDLEKMASFHYDTAEEFLLQCEGYPFYDFDDAFYALESLETYLTHFVRIHLEDF